MDFMVRLGWAESVDHFWVWSWVFVRVYLWGLGGGAGGRGGRDVDFEILRF